MEHAQAERDAMVDSATEKIRTLTENLEQSKAERESALEEVLRLQTLNQELEEKQAAGDAEPQSAREQLAALTQRLNQLHQPHQEALVDIQTRHAASHHMR